MARSTPAMVAVLVVIVGFIGVAAADPSADVSAPAYGPGSVTNPAADGLTCPPDPCSCCPKTGPRCPCLCGGGDCVRCCSTGEEFPGLLEDRKQDEASPIKAAAVEGDTAAPAGDAGVSMAAEAPANAGPSSASFEPKGTVIAAAVAGVAFVAVGAAAVVVVRRRRRVDAANIDGPLLTAVQRDAASGHHTLVLPPPGTV